MESRKNHILRKMISGNLPRYFVFFDTETEMSSLDEKKSLPFILGWACFWDRRYKKKNWLFFTDVKQFWNKVFKFCDKRKIILIAHNIDFDFQTIKGFDFLLDWEITKFVFEKVNFYSFVKNGVKLLFLDNGNFFRTSLENLGRDIGFPKMEKPDERDLENLKLYCKRDVEILVKTWEKFLSFLNNFGKLGYTIASTSFNIYRKNFMKEKIYIHVNKPAILLERNSYFGGRNECFKIGEFNDNISIIDVNSMYPFQMLNNELPCRLIHYFKNLSHNSLDYYLKKFSVISHVKILTKENCYPFFKNKLLFPIGEFETYLCTPELQHALSKDNIIKIYETSIYEKKFIFSDYINYFYKLKTQSKIDNNGTEYMLAKLFLNSLYGKFGEKHSEFSKTDKKSKIRFEAGKVYDLEKNKLETYKIINYQKFIKSGEFEGYDSLVAIPSHITSYARMYLWELLKIIGFDNIFYCDTDSIFCKTLSLKKIPLYIGNNIGQLSVELTGDYLHIYSNKDYKIDEKEKIKGIKKSAVRLNKDTFVQIQFRRIARAIREGNVDNVITEPIQKTLLRKYDKGVIKNGIVFPYKFKGGISTKPLDKF